MFKNSLPLPGVGAIVSLLLGAGCTVPSEERSEQLATLSQPLVSYFQWNAGDAAVPMIPNTRGFCYLTRLTGLFKGNGESVQIFNHKQLNRWYLLGASQQPSLSAEAACVSFNAFPGAAYGYVYPDSVFAAPNTTTFVAPINDIAPLTYVTGHFRGGGEWATVAPSRGQWFVSANHNSGSGVTAGAHRSTLRASSNALRPVSYAGRFTVSTGDGSTDADRHKTMIPVTSGVCYLARFTSESDDESSQPTQYAETTAQGGFWTLDAGSDAGFVQCSGSRAGPACAYTRADAECVAFN